MIVCGARRWLPEQLLIVKERREHHTGITEIVPRAPPLAKARPQDRSGSAAAGSARRDSSPPAAPVPAPAPAPAPAQAPAAADGQPGRSQAELTFVAGPGTPTSWTLDKSSGLPSAAAGAGASAAAAAAAAGGELSRRAPPDRRRSRAMVRRIATSW